MEKFWSSSCWKMKGFFSSLLAPGKDQVCLTGGLTECRSLRVVTVIAVWLMFSCDVCVEAWTPAGVEPNCAWHHHLCQLDYVSFSSFVKWATSISTSNENPSPVLANLILNFFLQDALDSEQQTLHTSIISKVRLTLPMSPTINRVAFAGKYQRSWKALIVSGSHFFICSSRPIGNR